MSHATRKQRLWIALGGVTVAVALVVIWWVQQLRNGDVEMPQGGPITLPSTTGEFSLAELGDNQLAVLFFGYTYCPDVCPMSLAVMRQTLASLDESQRKRLVPVLISVDPERDTLARLEEYVGYFGPRFIGATGSQAQLKDIAERYGVIWRKVETPDSAMDYSVDHTSSLYIVDREGEILQRVLYSPTPHALTAAVEQVLGKTG
ncbi:protein SCO1/2 [Modicisalibacter muralis]|uniref:Protein SCO1/2 n=1 Tax=Modicisalibacter muralis TaxID=119000 RepID=A0A1G9NPR2_9GAMM|nr:SCO family protein [Halomonas muralis]SDL88341.1 protein SCO1/2 [Halomonas muralis]